MKLEKNQRNFFHFLLDFFAAGVGLETPPLQY